MPKAVFLKKSTQISSLTESICILYTIIADLSMGIYKKVGIYFMKISKLTTIFGKQT